MTREQKDFVTNWFNERALDFTTLHVDSFGLNVEIAVGAMQKIANEGFEDMDSGVLDKLITTLATKRIEVVIKAYRRCRGLRIYLPKH